jgi:hypothetical protein
VESLLSRRAFESGASGWRGGAKLVAEVYKIYIYIYIIYISVSILAQVSSNGISMLMLIPTTIMFWVINQLINPLIN